MPPIRSRRLALVPLEDRSVPAVLDISGSTVTLTGGVGEINNLQATIINNTRFQFQETGTSPLTLSTNASKAGWTVDGPGKISGPKAGVSAMDIRLGDGNDSMAFDGFEAGLTRLTVDAGVGSDMLKIGQVLVASDNSVTLPNPEVPGVSISGDATFKGFQSASVYRYLVTGGNLTFTNVGSATPLNLFINRSINSKAVKVLGGSGDDTLGINYRSPTGAEIRFTSGTSTDINTSFSFDGGTGNNLLSVAGPTSAPHTFVATSSSVVRDSTTPIGISNVQKVSMFGASQSDAFTVTPSATTTFEVDGGDGADSLNVSSGPAVVGYSATTRGSTYEGAANVAGMKPINFRSIEALAPKSPISVAVSSPAQSAPVGRNVSFTIVVTNPSTATVTNVAIRDVMPAALENMTWSVTPSVGSSVSAASGTGAVVTDATIAPGGTIMINVTGKVKAGTVGQTLTYQASAMTPTTAIAGATVISSSADLPIRLASRPTYLPVELYAVGTGKGNQPWVKVYNREGGTAKFTFLAYDAAMTGGVNVATGDVTNDGVQDIITAPASGGAPHVKIWDGVTGKLVYEFMAYETSFTGGVNLATGYITGNEAADLVTGPGFGGGPHVKIWDGQTREMVRQFMAFDQNFRGGVNVAAGDMSQPMPAGQAGDPIPPGLQLTLPPAQQFTNTDGIDDVIVGAGFTGGPNVKVFSGADGSLMRDLMAFDSNFRGGVFVAAGDVDGDGRADIVATPGQGGGPVVQVFSGAFDIAQNSYRGAIMNYIAFDASQRSGYRVATVDINLDGKADILTSTGPGVGGKVVARDAATGTEKFVFSPFDVNDVGGISLG